MSLRIITGSMMGGKTTKIIEMKRDIEKDTKNKILILNHCNDSRYSNEEYIISHDKQKEVCKKSSRLLDFVEDRGLKEFTHIFIDEGQFFHPTDLLLFVKKCMVSNRQHIVVSGLISNANLGNLGGISDLMKYADDIIFLKGICNFCKEKNASCTYVKGISKKVSMFYDNKDEINMSKLNTYKFEPSCKRCWLLRAENE